MVGLDFYEDVLTDGFCKFLLKDSLANLSTGDAFFESNLYWPPRLVRSSEPILFRPYNEAMNGLILEQLINKKVIEHKNYKIRNFVWRKLSYLPWHDDQGYNSAVTIYLNDDWNIDWGGIFLYKEKGSPFVQGYVPKFNTAVKNDSGIWHAVTHISADAEFPRVTIQLFSESENNH